jgi:flagellar motor switch/type III secretory pathway protein FliN
MAMTEGDVVTRTDQKAPDLGSRADLEAFSARRLALNNAWYRQRAPLHTEICGRALLVSAHAGARAEEGGPVIGIAFKIDANEGHLVAPVSLLRAVLASLNVPLGSQLARAGILLALECAIAGLLDGIESRIGGRIELSALQDGPPFSRSNRLGARCSFGGAAFDICLTLPDSELLSPLLPMLRASCAADEQVSMPVEVAFRLGTTDLPAPAFKALAPGDVVVFDTTQLDLGQIAAILGECLIGFVEHEGTMATLATDVVSINDLALIRWKAIAHDNSTGRSVDADLKRLSFEWGRLTLSSRELASVIVGHCFDFGRDPGASVEIRIGSRHVGYGEIVQAAELSGVRIVRLFGRQEVA